MPRMLNMVDRVRWWILCVLALAVGMILIVHAGAKPFWHDEIFTILVSRVPLSTLWRASRDGVDLAPPLAALVTKAVTAMAGEGPIVTRVPEMAGFIVASLIAFVMVRRRSNVLAAFGAAMLLCFTPARDYAIEARGYGLTLGTFALALYAWTEAADGRSRTRNLVVMTVALAAGVWAHYYAVLAFLPIAAGEIVRQARQRVFERGPWLAMALAGAGIAPLAPLALASASQAAHFWTRIDPPGIGAAYQFIAGTLVTGRLLIAAWLLALLALFETLRGRRSTRRIAAHEAAAGVMALLLPAAGVLIGSIAGGLVAPRYLTLSSVGFALAVPLAIWRLTPDNAVGDLVLCVALLLSLVKSTGRALPGRVETFRDPVATERPALASALATGDPVVITGGPAYLQLWFYAPPGRGTSAIYLANPPVELRQTGTDTIDRGYLALSRWTPVPAVESGPFLAGHDTFRLYALEPDWLTSALRAAGASLEEVAREGDARLYVVRMR